MKRRLENAIAVDRKGYTLLELLVSSVAASMLMVGMASAIIITTQAISPPTEQQAVLDAAEMSFVIGDELQSAVHVSEQDSSNVEFILNDRDNDNEAETIEYEFTGGQLIRRHNATSGVLMSDLAAFSMTPNYRSVSETLEGSVLESSEQSLAGVTSGGNLRTWYLDPYSPTGQSIDVSHPDNTILWSITEVKLYLRRSSWYEYGENIIVQIREATGEGLPTSTVLAESTVAVSSLSTTYQTVTVPITGAERLLKTQNVCLVLMADDYVFGQAARVGYTSYGYTPSGHMVASSYYGSDWFLYSSRSLYYVVKGTRHTVDDTTHEVVREYIAGYDVEIQPSIDRQAVRRKVRLMNTPERLSGVWRLDFNTDPTVDIDIDHDGAEDWVLEGGGTFVPSIAASVLSLSDGELFQTTADNDFDGLITADVHCRGTLFSASGGGAVVKIPYSSSSSTYGLLTINVERTISNTQTVTIVAEGNTSPQTLALVNNLPDETSEIRVVIDPTANEVGVWVNEVFQGRSTVTQPLSGALKRATFGASGANAAFDFLSIRVGGAS